MKRGQWEGSIKKNSLWSAGRFVESRGGLLGESASYPIDGRGGGVQQKNSHQWAVISFVPLRSRGG